MFPSSPVLGRLLSGLGCAALLHGAGDAFGMGPAVFGAYVLLSSALVMRWRHRDAAPSGRSAWAAEGTWRLARSQEARPLRREPDAGTLLAFPDQRTFWSRVKLWVGGLGLLGCGLWWLLLTALLVMPDPAPALDQLFTSSFLPLVLVSLLLPVLFLVFLRSGLRGPADPFVPERSTPEYAPPPSPGRSARARSATSSPRGKKSHLRLVRDTTC
ncbi:hypothetical protein D187_007958 [Cystobacter fuscus DSM 2262]|uniref:Uncharacterized protein n=1 Tax=Cystobacter fuscus (strain ATCC 25194 / DSM 2262 / NBRC 100088 / M29) TaxID=1242864 RepID=S9P0L1_CYSF2|nr:hypothetical protein [Cystobacter fuscus]EPX56616.1 hypothetical protein D187_007958 [Cystobacter fuscus DSM 2262]